MANNRPQFPPAPARRIEQAPRSQERIQQLRYTALAPQSPCPRDDVISPRSVSVKSLPTYISCNDPLPRYNPAPKGRRIIAQGASPGEA